MNPNCVEYVWELENFHTINTWKRSPKIITKNNDNFYLFLYDKNTLSGLKDHAMIQLGQNPPYKHQQVQWTISLLNQNNEKFATDVSLTIFDGTLCTPEKGGFYLIKHAYVSKLLGSGKVKIYCEIKVLDNENSMNVENQNKIGQKEIQTESLKALEDYESLLESCKHSDVIFVVGKKEFKLHKTILSARSSVFAAMFDSDLSENKQNRVDIPDVDGEVFEELVRFIYTGKLPKIDQYALELFVASDKYQFESIKVLCESSLGENLSIESLASVLTLADMHSASVLKTKCVDFFTKNAAKIMKTKGWKEMVKTKNFLAMEVLEELAIKAESFLK